MMKKKLIFIFAALLIFTLFMVFYASPIKNKFCNDQDNEVFPIYLGIANAYIIKNANSLILVDTGTEGNEIKILNKISKLGFKPDQVKLILITHGHIDHFGSARKIKEWTGAKIAIHENDKLFLMEGKYAPVIPISWKGDLIKKFFVPTEKRIPAVIPDITFTDELDLNPFGINGKAISTPGHTKGSVSVILRSGKAIVGDLVMDYGSLDYAVFSYDKQILRESIIKVVNSGVQKVYVSHGKVYDIDVVKEIISKK